MDQGRAGALFILSVLAFSLVAVVPALASQTINTTVKPTDDGYVAANLNDNGTDTLGLRSLNTANLPILKIWYAWNLTLVNKTTGSIVGYYPVKIVTVAYFKFDLSSLAGSSVTNATLNLFSQNSNLTGASRLLVAYQVPSSNWNQGTLDWYNAPGFNAKVNSSTSVTNGVNGWYHIDLTRMAQNATGGQLSVALTFLALYQHNEEQVVFNSTRASGGQPYLSLTYVGNPPFSLSGLFDFSGGVNSTNAIGIVILVVVIFAILFALWWWRMRPKGVQRKKEGKPGPQSPRKEGAMGTQGGSAALAKGAKCPNCGTPVESDFKLCPSCGTELTEKKCGNCGKSTKMDFQVCPYCGNSLG